MTEGRFGAARRLPQEPVRAEPAPGDRVEAVSGRYRGSVGVLVAVENVQTPSGREVRVARFDRARAGATFEFVHCLETVR